MVLGHNVPVRVVCQLKSECLQPRVFDWKRFPTLVAPCRALPRLALLNRWGNTARDDAAREAHPECVAIIDAFASNTPSTQEADATLDPALL